MEPMAERAVPVCWICGAPLRVAISHNRNGKASLTLWCNEDGRHLRAFCNDRATVAEVVARLEAQAAAAGGGASPPGLQKPSGEAEGAGADVTAPPGRPA